MKTTLFLAFMLLFSFGFAQSSLSPAEPAEQPNLLETEVAKDSTRAFEIGTEVSLSSRFFWRGVKFGTGPSIQGMFNLEHKSGLGIGAFGAANLSGTFLDYGNTMNLYIYYTASIGEKAGFIIFIDDYYFYNEDNFQLAFDYGSQTLHYIEARLQAHWRALDATVGYSVYQGENQDTAPYIELGVSVSENTRLFAGGVTGASALNFQTDAGITNVGVSHSRDIKDILQVRTTFAVNPFYKNVYQEDTANTLMLRGITSSAINLIVAIVF